MPTKLRDGAQGVWNNTILVATATAVMALLIRTGGLEFIGAGHERWAGLHLLAATRNTNYTDIMTPMTYYVSGDICHLTIITHNYSSNTEASKNN